MDRRHGPLLDQAPELALPPAALSQVVSWSSEDDRPISLGEFLAARAPHAAKVFQLGPSRTKLAVPRPADLTDAEMTKVVTARLREGATDARLAVLGQGAFTVDQLIQEIAVGTELGKRLLSAERRHLELLDRLAEANKLRRADQKPTGVAVPDFEF